MSGTFNLQNLTINGNATTAVGGTIVATSCTGNSATATTATTATTLATSRTIGGVSFNGSANISLPGVNSTGNQDTTGNSATATTASRITVTSSAVTPTTTGSVGAINYYAGYVYICIATNTWVRITPETIWV